MNGVTPMVGEAGGENLSKSFLQIPKFSGEGSDMKLIEQQHLLAFTFI